MELIELREICKTDLLVNIATNTERCQLIGPRTCDVQLANILHNTTATLLADISKAALVT
jgi:hypothetical protein